MTTIAIEMMKIKKNKMIMSNQIVIKRAGFLEKSLEGLIETIQKAQKIIFFKIFFINFKPIRTIFTKHGNWYLFNKKK